MQHCTITIFQEVEKGENAKLYHYNILGGRRGGNATLYHYNILGGRRGGECKTVPLQYSRSQKSGRMQHCTITIFQEVEEGENATLYHYNIPGGRRGRECNTYHYNILGGRRGGECNTVPLLYSRRQKRGRMQHCTITIFQEVEEGENATLYHYYPHNQHLFSLPACASQQVKSKN